MNTERHDAKNILDEYESAVDIHFQELIKKAQREVQKTCDKWGWNFAPAGVDDFILGFPMSLYRAGHYNDYLLEFLEPEVYALLQWRTPRNTKMIEHLQSANLKEYSEHDFVLEIDEDYEYEHPAVHRICELGIEAAPGMLYFGAVTYDLIQKVMEVFASDPINGRKLIACLPKFKP
jgi:hypothetical protein